MRLLIDTNVLIDGYLNRQPFNEEWKEIRLLQVIGDIELWASAKSFTDVHYLCRHHIDTYAIQKAILESLDYLRICSIDGYDIKRAAQAEWRDFEDCIIYQAAQKTKADYIVTYNTQGFEETDIPAVSPHELLEKIKNNIEFVEEDD